MKLFVINGVDYTNRITMPTYKVSDMPVYTEWEDSNWTTHRNIHTWKAEGSFTLKFQTKEEFMSFMDQINELRLKDGTVKCSVYLNNKNTTKENVYLFIDYDVQNTLPYMGGYKDYDGFDVTIKER